MKKTHYLIGIFLVLALALVFSEAQAQEQSQWILKLTRNFGYGSGSDIQGNMTLSLGGDLNSITKVVYYIDDELMELDKFQKLEVEILRDVSRQKDILMIEPLEF